MGVICLGELGIGSLRGVERKSRQQSYTAQRKPLMVCIILTN